MRLLALCALLLAGVARAEPLPEKFRRVASEYREFRLAYGWVLEPRWTELGAAVTFAPSQRVETLVEELEREMRRARKRTVVMP